MSLAAFQTAFARLVAEPGFAAAVRRDGTAATAELSERELARLRAAASDPGLPAATSVHVGWRLGKLLMRLPLTRAALGGQLAARVEAYWSTSLPRALAFEQEAIEFAASVRDATELPAAVREVAAFEAATLALTTEQAERVEVAFTHDPEVLLAAAAANGDLAAVPCATACAIGRRDAAGRCDWTVRRPAAPSPAPRPSPAR